MNIEDTKELLCLTALDVLRGEISDTQLYSLAKMLMIEAQRRELLSKL